LIAKFRPALQTKAGLIEIRSLSNGLTLREVTLRDRESKTRLDHQEFPAREHEKHPKTRPPFYLNKWTQATALAAVFVASGAIIFYVGARAEQNNQKRLNGASGAPLKRISGQDSTWGRDGSSLRPQKLSPISTPSGRANQSAEVTLGSELNTSSAATENAKVRLASKITADDPPPVQPFLERAKPSPVVHHADSADLGEKWSVQVSAGPAKDIAGSLVERLKANGYDGYVIQTEVKGQTYYRVRVGRFATRKEAESVRRSLALEEGYRDAYLTSD
jgi:cell division septation protein DedD